MAATEERIEADLELGRHAEVVGELEALVAAHPLRERFRGQLMLALYRCHRQAEALEAYREGRQRRVEETWDPEASTVRRLARRIARDAAKRPERTQDYRHPDTRDGAAGRTAPVVEFVEVQKADGFDAGDAIVGAGSGLGLVLIATGGAVTTAHVRRRRLRSAQA